jgi:hypothetical protein
MEYAADPSYVAPARRPAPRETRATRTKGHANQGMIRMRISTSGLALALAALAALPMATLAPAAAQAPAKPAAITPNDFHVNTTAGLAKLCDASAADPMQVAAVQFCLGFGVGVFQTEQLRQAASRAKPIFCMPNPMPQRAEVMAGFIAWTKATPAVADIVPAAGVLQYLMQTYPCPAARR